MRLILSLSNNNLMFRLMYLFGAVVFEISILGVALGTMAKSFGYRHKYLKRIYLLSSDWPFCWKNGMLSDKCSYCYMFKQRRSARKSNKKTMMIGKKWDIEGEYVRLYKKLIEDAVKFHQYFRMSKNSFNLLFSEIKKKVVNNKYMICNLP